MTYGDGVSDVDISASIAFHESMANWSVGPQCSRPARFWRLGIDGTNVQFQEKPKGEGGWINGGFFLLSPRYQRNPGERWMFEQRADAELTAQTTGAGVFSSRFLAADGHAARQAQARRTVGQREGALEDVVDPWKGRRVFLTGHTGFKGGWLALWLASRGAIIRGYALAPSTEPNLFTAASLASVLDDIRGDIRDYATLKHSMAEFQPEVVFHLAAQPLVRRSYADPLGTYATNVMGTAHMLEAVRETASVRCVVCITTDKCYENREWVWPYRENDPLGGYDPYSSSKACAEIVSAAYRTQLLPCGSKE